LLQRTTLDRTVGTERGERALIAVNGENANLYAHLHNREPLNLLDCAALFGRATNSLLFTNVSTLEREFLTQTVYRSMLQNCAEGLNTGW
jgi:hypothetical protein